jgi:hypothetical protein
VLLALLALLGAVAGPAAGQTTSTIPSTTSTTAPPTTTPPTTTPPAPAPAARLRLASQTTWVPTGGEFQLRVDATGAEPDAELTVSVHSRLTSRSAFDITLEDRLLGSTLELVGPAPLGELTPDPVTGTRLVRLPLRVPSEPRSSDRVNLTVPGVYPVRVELREGDTRELLDGFTTHLVLVPDAAGALTPLWVAWAQPFRTSTPSLQPDGAVAVDPVELESLRTLATALAGHPGVPVDVAPTGEALESLAAAGGRAARVLDDLRSAVGGGEVVSGPYVDVDVAALHHAGLTTELEAQLRRGAALAETLAGARVDGGTWLASTPLDERALGRLGELGVQRVVVPSDQLEPVASSLTPAQPFRVAAGDGRALPGVAADAGLQRHFVPDDPAQPGADDVLRAHQLLADLAVLFFDSPGLERGQVVLPPAGWQPSEAFLDVALGGLTGTTVVRPGTLADLFARVPAATAGREPVTRTLAAGEPATLGVPVAAVRNLRDDMRSYATMVPEGAGAGVADAVERRLLASQAAGLGPGARRAYLAGARAALAGELAKIETPDGTDVRLTARGGIIPLTFRNTADHPVHVAIRLESDKLEFPGGTCPDSAPERCSLLDQRLAGGNTVIEVDVLARTSGTFPLTVSVRSPDGGLAVDDSRLTVRSTAASGVGVVLSAGALGFLVLWWGRHWRRTRRARNLVPA